jgi:hypothetical protein
MWSEAVRRPSRHRVEATHCEDKGGSRVPSGALLLRLVWHHSDSHGSHANKATVRQEYFVDLFRDLKGCNKFAELLMNWGRTS